ncbi:MAG: hypothetical protein DRQ78_07325 [Epsilonproteobacteria bacterium]|nr:MAG: hypothetical protein DRQ78_07325 [Campylobacterota bacterium]
MNQNNETEEVLENIEEIQELESDQEIIGKQRKLKKHTEATLLVKKAKFMVEEAEAQTEACKLLLLSDLQEYEDAKSELAQGGLDECAFLLESLGYKTKSDGTEAMLEDIPVFESKTDIEPIALKEISSGKFTAFIFAIFGGFIAAIALVYLATEKLNVTLDVSKLPSDEMAQNIFTWFSTPLGMHNLYVGIAVFFLAVLFVTGLIYIIRVAIKGSRNLHFANQQLLDAADYTEQKGNCKVEMDRVDAHIKDTISILKIYEVLFNEQKGKLERILYIEGPKIESAEYHKKSFIEIHETKELMRTIKNFISVSMSEEGRLSEQSIVLLDRAKIKKDKILERLY